MFFSALVEILGLSKGKTWDDIRKELSETQVKEIYGAFADLWPRDANIVELLPRPDEAVFRGLYTGLVDPRVIPQNVLNFSPYFDEIIMVNPITHPGHVRPEFSPLEVPGKYLRETLKIVSLFTELIPFIETGVVQVVPDPAWFNQSLRQISWKMAEERGAKTKVDPEKMGAIEGVLKDDFRRTLFGMPEDYLRKSAKKALPTLSEEEIREAVAEMKAQHARDPLAVLQPLRPGEENAQMLITHVTPNFETGFFLGQITGSVLYTDNQFRWEEILAAADSAKDGRNSTWGSLAEGISALAFDFELNPWVNLNARRVGKFGLIRKAFRNVVSEILKEPDSTQASSVVPNLIALLRDAHAATKIEWENIRRNLDRYSRGEPTQSYTGRLDCAIANRGFGVDAIRRLLLTFGTTKYWTTIPIAFRLSEATKAGTGEGITE